MTKDESTHLFGSGFFDLEQVIKPSLLNGLKQSRGNIHMSIQSVLSCRQFGQCCDGSLEMCSITRKITGQARRQLAAEPSGLTRLTFEKHHSHR